MQYKETYNIKSFRKILVRHLPQLVRLSFHHLPCKQLTPPANKKNYKSTSRSETIFLSAQVRSADVFDLDDCFRMRKPTGLGLYVTLKR